MGSDESHFNVSLIVRDKVTRPCPQTTTFLKRKESQASSNRGPSAYQPNALPLGQTGSHSWWWWRLLLYSAILRSRTDSLRSHVTLHEWLAFYSAFFWISTEVVYLQRWHGWCQHNAMKLLPSRRRFCVHHTTMHHATSCKATYVRCML